MAHTDKNEMLTFIKYYLFSFVLILLDTELGWYTPSIPALLGKILNRFCAICWCSEYVLEWLSATSMPDFIIVSVKSDSVEAIFVFGKVDYLWWRP